VSASQRTGRSIALRVTLRVAKWLAVIVAAVFCIVLVAAAYVYIASDRILDRTYEVPATVIAVPDDSASIARGRKLAALRGCTGCHGRQAEGQLFIDEPMIARITAPNLTRVVRETSDADLERIIRHGVYPDGRSVLAMPSSMFYPVSDEELGATIAFLRSLPLSDGPGPETKVGPLGRLGLVLGQFTPQAAQIEHDAKRATVNRADTVSYGRYIATTVCTECHGMDFGGSPDGATPDLAVATTYSLSDFRHLMRTGEAFGGRELGLMAEVASGRFSLLDDDEVSALHAFLVARVGH